MVPTITVRKHDWRGRFRYAWQGELIAPETGLVGDDTLLLRAIWEGPGEPLVRDIQFVKGDIFMEYYYPGRCWAVWAISSPNGGLKAWYANISTPVVQEGQTLSFNDLLLDVLVYPDERYVVLDRDEFEAAVAEGLPDDNARQAEQALREIIGLLEAGAPPWNFRPGRARPIAP